MAAPECVCSPAELFVTRGRSEAPVCSHPAPGPVLGLGKHKFPIPVSPSRAWDGELPVEQPQPRIPSCGPKFMFLFAEQGLCEILQSQLMKSLMN